MAGLCASLFTTIFGGLNAAVAYQVSRGKIPREIVLANALSLSGLLSLIAVAAGAIAPFWWRGAGDWIAYAVAGAIISIASGCFSGLFLGESNIATLNLSQIISSALPLGLAAVLLLGFKLGVQGALIAWVASLAAVLVWLGRKSSIRLSEGWSGAISGSRMKSLLTFGTQIGFTNLVGFLNYRADSFLIAGFIGVKGLGIYSVAVAAAEFLWFIPRAVSMASYGRLGREASPEAASLAAKALRHTALLLVPAALSLGTAGWLLIPSVYGQAFREAVPVLLVLLPGNMCYGLGPIYSAYFTNHLGLPSISLGLAGLSLLLDFVGCLLFVPHLGMVGGALASTISYLVTIIVCYGLFLRMTKLPWREALVVSRSDLREQMRLLRTVTGL
jgi:O-antigen/teichoic acid export membrane protein